MTDRFPLIVDSTTGTVKELPSGDNIKLNGSSIVSTDSLPISIGGTEGVKFSGNEVVFNDGGVDYDFRIEGNNNPNLFTIDAANDQVNVANLNGSQLAGFRNFIINGDMAIWQRGLNVGLATTTQAGDGSTTGYTADRWATYNVGLGRTVTRSTNAPEGFNFSMSMVGPSSTGFACAQGIELIRPGYLGEFTGNWTVSFYTTIPSPLVHFVGSYGVWPSAGNYSYPAGISTNIVPTSTGEVSNGFTRYKHTFDLSTLTLNANNICLALTIGSAAFTVGVAQSVTGVQFEPGTIATPFEHRSPAVEHELCRRYYQNIDVCTANTCETGSGSYDRITYSCSFPVPMRTSPSVSFINTGIAGSFAAQLQNGSYFEPSRGGGYLVPVGSSVTPGDPGDRAAGPSAGTPLLLVASSTGIARAQASRSLVGIGTVVGITTVAEKGVQYMNFGIVMSATAEF
jgi:hypothetical protein